MRTQLEIICDTEQEVELIEEWVEGQEHCTVEMLVHDNRVTLYSFWLDQFEPDNGTNAQAEERKRWQEFVCAYFKHFGY